MAQQYDLDNLDLDFYSVNSDLSSDEPEKFLYLESLTQSESEISSQPQNPCKICLEEVDPPFFPCRCNFAIHYECLEDWLDRVPQEKCDICREEYRQVETIRCKCFRPKKNCPLCYRTINKVFQTIPCFIMTFLIPLIFLILTYTPDFIQHQYTNNEITCYESLFHNPPDQLPAFNFLYTKAIGAGVFIGIVYLIALFLAVIFDLKPCYGKPVFYRFYARHRVLNSFLFQMALMTLSFIIGIIYRYHLFPEYLIDDQIPPDACPRYLFRRQSRMEWLKTDINFTWYTFLPGYLTILYSLLGLPLISLIVYGILICFCYYPYKIIQNVYKRTQEQGCLLTFVPCCIKKEIRIQPYRTN